MTPILLLLQLCFFYSFASSRDFAPCLVSCHKWRNYGHTRQSKIWLHLARVACMLEKRSGRNIHTQRNIPNIPNETYRKRLSHSAVKDFPVYPTICLTTRSTKAQHVYMHTCIHTCTTAHAYLHTHVHAYTTAQHTCMHTYMHTYIHIHMQHTCMHTQIHVSATRQTTDYV
jgi:hypothetical protein